MGCASDVSGGLRDMDGTTRARPAPRRHTSSLGNGIDAAPHVRAAVRAACGGASDLAAEILAALDPPCRRGWRALPDPLPSTPALADLARRTLPRDADPDQALALALCGAGPLTVLCAITGTSAEQIASSALGPLVEVHSGAFRFADAALRTSVLAGSSAPERVRAHRLLAAAFTEAGDAESGLWHRACGSAVSDPGLVEPLLAQAGAALSAGSASRAWARAREAADHARPGTQAHAAALLCAGRAALAGGWVVDALELLDQALRLEGTHRDDATAEYVLAHTLRHGTVPSPEAVLPIDAAGPGYRRAAVLGASLSAERGDHERSAAWLAAAGRLGCTAAERAALLAWCDALAGEGPGTAALVGAEGAGCVAAAVHAGLAGDPEEGLRLLADPAAVGVPDAVMGLAAQSPVLRACRAVAEVLLQVWAGRIGVAREALHSAATLLPVSLPFDGLAVTLSRRLDLAVEGRIGPCSHDLAAAMPWTREPVGFVDRALDAYLRGRSDEAAVHMGLWADQGRRDDPLGVPGLDEVGPLGAPGTPEPPDASLARALRERVRAARRASWLTDLDAVADESRRIRSPFERARVEALLGSTCVVRGDRVRGVRHLRAARSLFEEAGAGAWRRMVDRRLRMMAEPRDGVEDVAVGALQSLEVCRAAWEPILTARELQVALLMAEGHTNREIALALHVSVRTVEVHGGRIFAKLDVRTRHELTVLAHRTDQHL